MLLLMATAGPRIASLHTSTTINRGRVRALACAREQSLRHDERRRGNAVPVRDQRRKRSSGFVRGLDARVGTRERVQNSARARVEGDRVLHRLLSRNFARGSFQELRARVARLRHDEPLRCRDTAGHFNGHASGGHRASRGRGILSLADGAVRAAS